MTSPARALWPTVALLACLSGSPTWAAPKQATGAPKQDAPAGSSLMDAIEFSIDLHFGLAYTPGDELEVRETDETAFGEFEGHERYSERIPSSSQPMIGGRLTVWIGIPLRSDGYGPRFAFGAAVEGSFYSADAGVVERHDVYRGMWLILARVELLRSPERPHGLLRPYFGGGLGGSLSSMELELPPEGGGPVDDTSIGFVADVRAGLSLALAEDMAFYVEYSLGIVTAESKTHLDKAPQRGWPDYPGDVVVDRTISSHTVVAGVSFLF